MIANVRDSFLKFLSENLEEIPIHVLRRDTSDPESSLLQPNALNVQFLTMELNNRVSYIQVALDLLNDDEDTAVVWVGQLWTLLSTSFYYPLSDYTDINNPTPVGTNMMWSPDGIRFRPISVGNYFHYTCTLPVQFRAL